MVTGCAGAATAQKSGFNFIFKYGVMARNELNTFQDKFTKDMISDPSVTIDLVLTTAEMDSINQKMVDIDFFSYLDEFKVEVTGDIIGMVTPYSSYYFKVEYASGIKELSWEDEITNSDAQGDKLKELINLIKGIIESKAEYQALPKPSGGYV